MFPINYKCEINTRDNPCGFTPQVTAKLLKELDRPYLFVEGKSVAGGKIFIRQTLDFCLLAKNPGLNIFVRLFYLSMKDSINFKFECPFKVASYEFKHLSYSPTFDLLLNFFPLNKLYHVKVSIRRKDAGKVKDVFIFNTFFMVVDVEENFD